MTTTDDQKPTVDELYSTATHTSNLRMEMDSERRSNADILVAAAWSPSRLGSALLRLHSEWDGAAHPRKISPQAIREYALTLAGTPTQRKHKAHQIAHDWYLHEVALLLGKLKTLPVVRYQLSMQASKWEIEDPERTACAVLLWWLDHVCPECQGRKEEIIPDSPSLSGRACQVCRGSGERPLPYWGDGRRLLNHIEGCIGSARVSIRQRLRR